jgi:PIN domain nuclease of toxin-antitoxin system
MPIETGTETLLDTHVWIWLVDGKQQEIAPAARRALTTASEEGAILVSIMSVWEVAMLESKGRIGLSREIEEWVDTALDAPGIMLTPIEPAIAIESTRLPDWTKGDPVDRLLVATARYRGARLATRDRELIRYGRAGHVEILDVFPRVSR